MIDFGRLESDLDIMRQSFAAALPFPHIVIDDVIDDAWIDHAVAAWPDDSAPWKMSQRGKQSLSNISAIPNDLARLIVAFNSSRFVAWLASVTGIADLSPDHTIGGAGLHQVQPGGSLQMHVDFNRMSDMYRRLNVLLFVNPDWKPQWGGDLELMDHPKKPTERVCIAPTWNRLVIQESSDRSWHGHPHPLLCPENRRRRSIATYYYSREPHPSYGGDHSTEYVVDRDRLRKETRAYEAGTK